MLSPSRLPRQLQAWEELRSWARARGYWDRGAEYLELARNESGPDVQNRYITIALHYRALAKAEERSAALKGDERRARAALKMTEPRSAKLTLLAAAKALKMSRRHIEETRTASQTNGARLGAALNGKTKIPVRWRCRAKKAS